MQQFPRTREEALGSVEREVRLEQATSLGRVGRQLEVFLEKLEAVRQALEGLEGPARRPLVLAHAELRKQAELYLWYLTVQREAMGIRQHGDLEDFYPIPRSIRE